MWSPLVCRTVHFIYSSCALGESFLFNFWLNEIEEMHFYDFVQPFPSLHFFHDSNWNVHKASYKMNVSKLSYIPDESCTLVCKYVHCQVVLWGWWRVLSCFYRVVLSVKIRCSTQSTATKSLQGDHERRDVYKWGRISYNLAGCVRNNPCSMNVSMFPSIFQQLSSFPCFKLLIN